MGLSLGDVLLGLMETGEGQPDPAADTPARPEPREGPALRLRMPDGRVEREPLPGGFWRRDRAGGFTSPRVATRREGQALACKLYRVGKGRAFYTGALKAAGARAFVEAAPGEEYRCRNAPLRRMTAEELAGAADPTLVYDYDLLGAEERQTDAASTSRARRSTGVRHQSARPVRSTSRTGRLPCR